MINIIGNIIGAIRNLVNGVDTVDLISGSTIDILNRYVDINFDPNAYNSSGGAVTTSDLTIVFDQNGGTATNVTISSVTKTTGAALTGGESTIRVNLSITGSPNGVEEIEIKPSAQGSITDSFGRLISSTDGTGSIQLELEYDALYKAGILYALTNSITPPSKAQRLVDNTLFTSLRTNSILTELDGLFLFTHSNAFSRYDFARSSYTGSFTGTVTITPFNGGIASSGGYFNTGYDPLSDAVNFSQNDASIGAVIGNNASASARMGGSRGSPSGINFGAVALLPRNASDQAALALNTNSSGNGAVSTGTTDSEGVLFGNRTASNAINLYLNGTSIATGTAASSTLTDNDFLFWSHSADGTPNASNTVHEGMALFYGSSLSTKVSEINTCFSNWKASTEALAPTLNVRLTANLGQSLMDRCGLTSEETGATSPYDSELPDPDVLVYWDDEIVELEVGVNGVDKNGGGTWWGPAYALGVILRDKYPGDKILILHQATGGTGMLTASGANNWIPGGTFVSSYETFKREYDEIDAAVDNIISHEKVTWIQGHTDATYLNFQNSASLSAVNGATSMTTSAAHGVVAGRPVYIRGVEYITTTGTTGTTLVITTPYAGITETVPAGSNLQYDRGDADDYGPIDMRNKTVFDNSATLSAVNGASSMTTSANHGVNVDDWVRIDGWWYRAITGTTGSTLVIEGTYLGSTTTVANSKLFKASPSGGTNNESTVLTAIRSDTGFEDFIVVQPNIESLLVNYPNLSAIRAQKRQNFLNGLYGTGGALKYIDNSATYPIRDTPHLTNTGGVNMSIDIGDEY